MNAAGVDQKSIEETLEGLIENYIPIIEGSKKLNDFIEKLLKLSVEMAEVLKSLTGIDIKPYIFEPSFYTRLSMVYTPNKEIKEKFRKIFNSLEKSIEIMVEYPFQMALTMLALEKILYNKKDKELWKKYKEYARKSGENTLNRLAYLWSSARDKLLISDIDNRTINVIKQILKFSEKEKKRFLSRYALYSLQNGITIYEPERKICTPTDCFSTNLSLEDFAKHQDILELLAIAMSFYNTLIKNDEKRKKKLYSDTTFLSVIKKEYFSFLIKSYIEFIKEMSVYFGFKLK